MVLWHAHDFILAVGEAGAVLSILSGDMLLGLAVPVEDSPVAHILSSANEDIGK